MDDVKHLWVRQWKAKKTIHASEAIRLHIVGLHPVKLKRTEKVKIHFPAEFFTELVMLSSHTLVDDAKYFLSAKFFAWKYISHAHKAIRQNARGLN